MKTKLLLKPLLLAVGLLVGGSAWAQKVYSPAWNDDCSTKTSWKTHSNASSVNVTTNNALVANDYYVNFKTDNGKDRSNYYDLSAANANFGKATDYTFEFDLAIYGSNATNHLAHAILKGTDSESTAVDVFSIDCTEGNTFQLNAGTAITAQKIDITDNNRNTRDNIGAATVWHHYTVVSNAEGTTLTVEKWVSGEKTSTIATTKIAEGLILLTELQLNGGSYQQWSIDNLALSVYSDKVLNPSASITSVNGISRTITMTQGQGYDIYYYETEDNYDITGLESVKYTAPLVINTTKYYVIFGKNGTKVSDNVNCTFEAGTAIKLNNPVISRSGISVTITSDQTDIICNPSATIYYTYGDGDPVEYSGAITVEADATITAYASATGYTNSDNVTRAVALFPTDVAKVIDAPENNTYTTGALNGVDVAGTNATFQALIIDGEQWGGKNVYVQSTNFGFRNGGSNKHWYIDSTSDVWLLIKYAKAGDIIIANTDYQASNLTNATYTEKYSEGTNRAYTVTADGDVEIAFKKINSGTMHYLYGLYVWSHPATATINPTYGWATFCSPYALDFSNVTGLKAYIATAADDTKVSLERVEGTVAAGTGLVIRGATTDIPVVASGTTYEQNKLVACLEDTQLGPIAGATRYVLSVQEIENKDEVVFAPVAANASPTVKAGQAYLSVESGTSPTQNARAQFLTLSFGNVATGISTVEAQKTVDGEVYNLSGQRVSQPTKGLYIVNGKKVIK